MNLFKSFLVALSTYSRVPVPNFEWNEKNMKYAICFLPSVGVLCGGLLFGWYVLCGAVGISNFFFSIIAVCIPVLITGGIHIDGYMDTVDALSSYQDRERKLEILKDPNCGAFAVIYCIVYILLDVALMYELYNLSSIIAICPVFVLSRTLSVICAVNIPNARKNGMLHSYTENAERKKVNAVMIIVAVITSVLLVAISPVAGGLIALCALICVVLYFRMVKKEFGGVTGDTAGFFLQICELFCMIGAWIGALLI